MSETPTNKLRALCEKLKSLSWDDSGLCTDPDVDECADELRAILPDVERLVEALRESIECVGEFVDIDGNEWHDGTPMNEHYDAWKAALALFDQPVARCKFCDEGFPLMSNLPKAHRQKKGVHFVGWCRKEYPQFADPPPDQPVAPKETK